MRFSPASIAALLIACSISPRPVQADPPKPELLTAQEDHKRMMELLKIKELRRGADGNNPKAPNAANKDEAKATPYPNLPDPLVMKSGKKITTAAEWKERRTGFKNSISLDQSAAEHLYGQTRFPTLTLSCERAGLSWTKSGAPVPTEDWPSAVFAKIVPGGWSG